MRAVGFALTGSDNAELKVIDRASCVFAVKNDLFRLNNVYTDRIKIQGRQRQSFGALEQSVTVTHCRATISYLKKRLSRQRMRNNGAA
jgi:hypothetical protein